MMRTARRRNVLAGTRVLTLAASLFYAFEGRAQSEESMPAPLAGQFIGEPSPVFKSALAVLEFAVAGTGKNPIFKLMVHAQSRRIDGVVHGGEFDKTYLGINWWTTRRLKIAFG